MSVRFRRKTCGSAFSFRRGCTRRGRSPSAVRALFALSLQRTSLPPRAAALRSGSWQTGTTNTRYSPFPDSVTSVLNTRSRGSPGISATAQPSVTSASYSCGSLCTFFASGRRIALVFIIAFSVSRHFLPAFAPPAPSFAIIAVRRARAAVRQSVCGIAAFCAVGGAFARKQEKNRVKFPKRCCNMPFCVV